MVPCQAMSSHVCVVPRLLDGIAQLLFRVFARPVLVMEEPDRLCDLIRFMFLNSLYARLPATLSGLPGWCGTYKELWTALASEATRSRSPWSRCAVPGTHPRCPMEVLTHLDTLLFGRLFGRHVLICFDMLSRCCPHVVHMLSTCWRSGSADFCSVLSPHMASVVPKFSHSLHYVTVPLRGFRWCGAWWSVATIPYNTKQDWYQWIASSSALCPGRRRNLDFTKLSIFGRGRPRKIAHFRYLSYFEDFNVQSKHIEVLFVSWKSWYRFPYVSVKDGCLRTMAPWSKKAEGSGSRIISGWSGDGLWSLDSGHIFAIFHFGKW